MEAKQTVRLFLTLSVLQRFGMSFVFSTYVLYLNSRGMNVFQVNLVNFVYYLTIFLFEVPTGVIADVFGRKTSFVISCFLWSLSSLVYSQATTYWGFALAEAIGAIGATCASGAFQAWLVDKLKHHQSDLELGPVLALEGQLGQVAVIAGAISGAWLADHNQTWPWKVAAVVELICGMVAFLTMREEYFKKPQLNRESVLRSIRETVQVSLHFGRQSQPFRFVLLLGALMAMTLQAPNMQWQPFFRRFLQNETSCGLIFGGIALSVMIGSKLSMHLQKRCRHEKRALASAQLLIGICLLATAYLKVFPLTLGIFLLHEVARGACRPIKDTYLNHHIPSKERATLLSMESMAQNVGGMIGLLGSGLLAQQVSIPFAWVVSGGLLLIATLWLMRNGKA